MSDMNKDNNYVSYGISFGLLGGTIVTSILSVFTSSPLVWALGPGIGMLLGLIVSLIMVSNE